MLPARIIWSDPVTVYQGQAVRRAAELRLDRLRRHHGNYRWVDEELSNLRQTFGWLSRQADEHSLECMVEYVRLLAPYLHQRSLEADLLAWSEPALSAAMFLNQNVDWLLLERCQSQRALGRWTDAMATAQAVRRAGAQTDPGARARASLLLGQLQFNCGAYREALTMLAEAEALLAEVGDEAGV